jgi:uncharacterized protein (UPF0332 family)
MKRDIELSKQIKIMMAKAKDSLGVAKQLHEQKHYNDAASKAYYAVFHSLQAILLTKGLSFSKHSAVLSAFNKEFIYRGGFAKISTQRLFAFSKTARLEIMNIQMR